MSVFCAGDVVYHSIDGKCVVCDVYGKAVEVTVSPDSTFWTNEELLSFKPWPAPCHERPIEDGLWICSAGSAIVVRRRLSGEWYVVDKHLQCKSGAAFNYDNIVIKKIAD